MEVQEPSDGLPRASQELFKTAQTMKNLVFPCKNHGFSSFALFDDRMLLDSLWSAFWSPLGLSGEPFGEPWAFQSASWAALGGSWARLGTPKALTWRPKALSGAQLGGPKRSKMPTWRSKARLEAQLGGPKAFQDANLAPQSPAKSLALEDQSI